ncbi:MAG TPA: recombinase RecJ, partial [Candidatus Micrarchaeota archaeon]|nr:recombinase RecJ [Candidatus Micrarchaeota archaeon]
DHHQTEGTKTLQANPQLHGFDGGREISAAGVAHLVFGVREDLAIVGAVGDVQAPLVSLNREILQEAEKKGTVEARVDLKAYGKNTRSLAVFLAYSDEPYLPGITGNEEASVALLEQAGLKNKPFETTYNDLPENEKSMLRAAIVEYLSRSGFAGVSADLFGECYILKNQPEKSELRDASEFSTLLNACGRNGRFEVGMGVCLGEPGALDTAKSILAEHKK